MVLGLILRGRETAVSEWREMKREHMRCYGKGDWNQAFLDPALIKSCMTRLLNFLESQFSYLWNEDYCILLCRLKAAWSPDIISAYIMILPSTLLSTFESLVCFIQDTGNLTSVDDLRYSVMWRQRVGCKRCITQGRLGVWNLGMAEDIFQFEWRWGLSYQTAEETVTSAVFLATALIPCSIPVPAWEKSTPLPLGRVSTLLAWIVASLLATSPSTRLSSCICWMFLKCSGCHFSPALESPHHQHFTGGAVVKASLSNAGGEEGSIPGQGAKIPYTLWPRNQNINYRSNILTNSIKTKEIFPSPSGQS